jgi:hypothetical protein
MDGPEHPGPLACENNPVLRFEMSEEERSAKLASLARCREMGERAYDGMYEAHSFRDANDCYRDAKEFFYESITLADELGLTDTWIR